MDPYFVSLLYLIVLDWFTRPGHDKDSSISCWTDGTVIIVEEVWKSVHIEQRVHICLALFIYAVANNIIKKVSKKQILS